MENKIINICFVNATNPNFEGGVILFIKNLVNYIKSLKKDVKITWIYGGKENKTYTLEEVNYIEIKIPKILFLRDFIFNKKVSIFLKNKKFDIINSHALSGHWMNTYKKRFNQKITHTYHGITFPYYKVHLKRFNLIKRIFLSPLLLYSYLIEKPPIKKADKIICVSEKVKKQLKNLYKSKREMNVLRTGVNLEEFKPRNKEETRKKLNLEKDKLYGLHIGKGGYWIKGLDRAVKISQEIYKKNKNYRLIIVGAERNKIKHLMGEDFILYKEKVPRNKISFYYNSADFFFCLSRYEGGAPTLVVSEAMASGCPIIFSKDSKQEIIEDEKNGLIINKFEEEDAKRIIKTLNKKKKKQEIIKNSIKTIKNISLDKWGKEYINVLLE